MNRYAVMSSPSSIWFTILDCETDQFVMHEVENKHGVPETAEMRFRHREAAEYHAARLNEAENAKAEV